jgi:hypothetical protein
MGGGTRPRWHCSSSAAWRGGGRGGGRGEGGGAKGGGARKLARRAPLNGAARPVRLAGHCVRPRPRCLAQARPPPVLSTASAHLGVGVVVAAQPPAAGQPGVAVGAAAKGVERPPHLEVARARGRCMLRGRAVRRPWPRPRRWRATSSASTASRRAQRRRRRSRRRGPRTSFDSSALRRSSLWRTGSSSYSLQQHSTSRTWIVQLRPRLRVRLGPGLGSGGGAGSCWGSFLGGAHASGWLAARPRPVSGRLIRGRKQQASARPCPARPTHLLVPQVAPPERRRQQPRGSVMEVVVRGDAAQRGRRDAAVLILQLGAGGVGVAVGAGARVRVGARTHEPAPMPSARLKPAAKGPTPPNAHAARTPRRSRRPRAARARPPRAPTGRR